MFSISWQDHWNLHIDPIDEEHRALVEGLNRLAERFVAPLPGLSGQEGNGNGVGGTPGDDLGAVDRHRALITALEILADQTREHFKHEEALMRAIDYPELAAHRSEHALLLAEYVEMVRDLDRQATSHLDAETLAALQHWLVGHMVGADREYANHYAALIQSPQEQSPGDLSP